MAIGCEINPASNHRQLCSDAESIRLRQHIKDDEKRQRRRRKKKQEERRRRKERSRHSSSRQEPDYCQNDDSPAAVISANSREALQLELVVMRRRERELKQRLINVQIEKERQLKEIWQPVQAMRQELASLSLVDKELYFRSKEIDDLQEEQKGLKAKSERLAMNIHNLRVNSRRLQDFATGNRDYYKMLQMHHHRLESDNLKLQAQEDLWKNKVDKLSNDIENGTAYIYAEHRLKQTIRKTARSAIHLASEGNNKELIKELNASFKSVEKYEAASDTPLSFAEKDKTDKAKKKRGSKTKKGRRSESQDDVNTDKIKKDRQSKSNRKRRSHRKPKDRLQDSWKSM